MIYTVYSVDMWGHVPADCCAAYDCDCVEVVAEGNLQEGEELHDEDSCTCHEDMNDRFRIGRIEVPDDAGDESVLDALLEGMFLSDEGRRVCVVDDWACDGESLTIHDDAGRVVFYLKAEIG